MASKFHQNSILTGHVDSFCLACESYLRTDDDICHHIEKPVHKKNLQSCHYFEKFKDDCIRKVKKGYYCEFCNLLFPTTAKVGLHIIDQRHMDTKGAQQLKRVGNSVVGSEFTYITEKAWNGFIDDTCAVCNTEFLNESIHKHEQDHILNLVQMKMHFKGDSIYRTIDKSSFQCLTCNMLFALNTMETHSEKEDHKKLLAISRTFNAQPVHADNARAKECDIGSVHSSKFTIGNKINDCSIKIELNNNETNPKHVADEVMNKKSDKNDKYAKVNNVQYSVKKEEYIPIKDNADGVKQQICSIKKKQLKMDQFVTKSDKSKTEPNTAKSKIGDENETNHVKQFEKKPINKKQRSQSINGTTEDTKSNKAEAIPIGYTQEKQINVKEKKIAGDSYDKDKILDKVPEYQKNGININFETETAFCKKCFESVDLDFDAIEAHIEQHNNNTKKENTSFTPAVDKNNCKTVLKAEKKTEDVINKNIDAKGHKKNGNIAAKSIDSDKKALVTYMPTITQDELQDEKQPQEVPTTSYDLNDPVRFAKAHKLTYNKGNNNAFCRVCNAKLPSSLRSMKEHINGASHRNKAGKLANIKPIIPKKPMRKFVEDAIHIQNPFSDDIIVNDRFCVTRHSFLMISKHELRLRCQACEVNLTEDDIEVHMTTYSHEQAMDNTPVLWSLHSEFVREVRTELFHCGFCNLIVGRYDDVTPHLQSTDHQGRRRDAHVRLQAHIPALRAHQSHNERLLLEMMVLRSRYGCFF